eukprot:CAMPEP_0173264222 /NCGR_PEP_ID=MMETSP1142-20121109/27854_1 /TAXON_ID=483371 /ORGANISM="non described non described, Strain CCMP2298" /LENGTH=61 /DNA_ID=CAMNT_0014199735 /DNA_START=438 /DNA_END=624 /DNA_ORIENTATION=+
MGCRFYYADERLPTAGTTTTTTTTTATTATTTAAATCPTHTPGLPTEDAPQLPQERDATQP